MRALVYLQVAVAATLATSFLAPRPAYAAESGWSSEHPWWCNHNNEVCMKYASESHYVGPTYHDCYAILETGWTRQDAVDYGCAGNA